ncbi:hypothetical protein J7443_14410 [Tropicibacter sp. R15_0]|uniref:hypothetical protein n=1 Tax=Tropicibacter sp. R15_0 TaxID=2821101 RepID=UPI001ADC8081|nr:hypothetical protein [Tropicibacter sp. R15_0]MBO9466433.1 hypothetical protein [Tropicibacter sp. R15_0]
MSFQKPNFRPSKAQKILPPKAERKTRGAGGSDLRSRSTSLKARLYRKTQRHARYLGVLAIGFLAIWLPSLGYLSIAKPQYTSSFSLILPGAGSSTTVNLNNFGQASSYANSAFANGSISPTETYKRLIVADRILTRAAEAEAVTPQDFGRPRIKLVDQTNLIHVELSAGDPSAAQARARALLQTFFQEIDALRQDEIEQRQAGGKDAIADYVASVGSTRRSISDLRGNGGLMSPEQFRDRVTAVEALADSLRRVRADQAAQLSKVTDLETALQISAEGAAATLKLFADEEYRGLLSDLSKCATAFNLARSRFGPRHPQRVSAKTALDTAQGAVLQRASHVTGFSPAQVHRLDRAPDGARAELLAQLVREHASLEALKKEQAALQAQHNREAQRLKALEPVASELEDRQRDFEVAEAVFASAIARSQSSKTDIYASYPLVQVLEDPSLPDRPTSPKSKLIIAAAIAASLMLIIAAMLGWSRDRVIAKLLHRPQVAKP